MRRFISTLALSIALVGSAAHAQDRNDYEGGRTVRTDQKYSRGYLVDEKIGIRPQAGTVLFKNFGGDTEARAAAGVTLDANLASLFTANRSNWYFGPSTGAIFSHTGDTANANFFGSSGDGAAFAGSNLLIIPANAKLGYNLTDGFRVAVHGGGNLLYKSVAAAINTGANDTLKGGSDWGFKPNVGADLEYSLTNNVALTLRPDLTFTSGEDIFTGTVALAIPIG